MGFLQLIFGFLVLFYDFSVDIFPQMYYSKVRISKDLGVMKIWNI